MTPPRLTDLLLAIRTLLLLPCDTLSLLTSPREKGRGLTPVLVPLVTKGEVKGVSLCTGEMKVFESPALKFCNRYIFFAVLKSFSSMFSVSQSWKLQLSIVRTPSSESLLLFLEGRTDGIRKLGVEASLSVIVCEVAFVLWARELEHVLSELGLCLSCPDWIVEGSADLERRAGVKTLLIRLKSERLEAGVWLSVGKRCRTLYY